jgi:hypothetical protein
VYKVVIVQRGIERNQTVFLELAIVVRAIDELAP